MDPVLLVGRSDHVVEEFAQVPLSETELRRANALHNAADRHDFVAAHALVRVCAARLLRRAAEGLTVHQACGHCGGPHGRPRLSGLPEVHLSLSHSRGAVAAAAGSGPVGVDIESTDATGDVDAVEWALTAAEVAVARRAPDRRLALLRQWVRKEAFIKVGEATMGTVRNLDLSAVALPAGRYPPVQLNHFAGWYLLDWTDPDRANVGAAVTTAAPHFATVALSRSTREA